MNKNIRNFLIISCGVIILIIILLTTNTVTAKCELDNLKINAYFNSSNSITQITSYENKINTTNDISRKTYCFYTTTSICREGEINYSSACLYKPKGFFESTTGIIILSLMGLSILGVMFYYIYISIKPTKEIKETFVNWSKGKKLIEEYLCNEYKIYHYFNDNNLHYRDGAISWINRQQDYVKNQERFMRAEVEIIEGKQPGVYTVDVNLSKGEDFIKNGNFIFEKTFFGNTNFKLHEMPRNEVKDPIQRRLEKLGEINPEFATRFEEKMVEQEIEKLKKPETMQEEMLPQDIMNQQQQISPWYRKRYEGKKYYGR